MSTASSSSSSSSTSKVLFSIEQWELIRRLRNSGVTKENICQAYDDLERVDRDLGNFCTNSNINNNNNNTNMNNSQKQHSYKEQQHLINNSNINDANSLVGVDPNLIMKNLQLFFSKNLSAPSPTSSVNGDVAPSIPPPAPQPQPPLLTPLSQVTSYTTQAPVVQAPSIEAKQQTITNQTPVRVSYTNGNHRESVASDRPTSETKQLPTTTSSLLTDADLEAKEIETYKARGDYMNHLEISQFVHKFDLKQNQIAKMSGVNQSTISKFIRGEASGISDNAKTLIYKWYLKFTRNPFLFGKIFSSNDTVETKQECSDTLTNVATQNGNSNGANGNSSGFNNTHLSNSSNVRRTRFSFKSEHLVILENYFVDNQYPDSSKREELARLCNQARGGDVSEKERVTEQMVMNWFQNKRNLRRTMSVYDEAQIEAMTSCMDSQNADSLEYDENSRNSPLVSESSEYD